MKILNEIWDTLPEIHAFASLKMVVILWICSIWPKDHRTVIFFSAWIKAQIWVKWLSYFFYKSYHRLCEEDWFCTAEDFCLSAKQSNLIFVKIVVTEIVLPKRKNIIFIIILRQWLVIMSIIKKSWWIPKYSSSQKQGLRVI